MATIALRVPTVVPDQANLPGGHCYILFPEPTITVRELIAEKVRAELRKARAGGAHSSSLALLLPEGTEIGYGPLDEQLAIVQASRSFMEGDYLLLCDGRPMVDLDETVSLSRRTALVFLCPSREAAAGQPRKEAA
ncbi:MAG: hypothetical protein M3380_08395 [Chloroflexota bacterium]|nr:hypothetical protein [Chloroflexota bacterium]